MFQALKDKMATIFQTEFLNAFSWMKMYKIHLKFVPKSPINNIPALVQIMAWHRSSDEPLSQPIIVSVLTHLYVARPQWINHATWHQRCGSTLYTVMACCLMAQSHYVHRQHAISWTNVDESSVNKMLRIFLAINHKNVFSNYSYCIANEAFFPQEPKISEFVIVNNS